MPARSAQEQFDRQAAHYNAQWNRWSEGSLRWLLEHAHASPADRLLDVATGTGFTAMAFAPLVAEVAGVDVSGGMLAKAREQVRNAGLRNVRFEQGAAESLPFQDASFDLVTCRVAPHHFISVPKFLAEVRRVLTPGGRFLLADTTVPDEPREAGVWQNRVELLRDPSHMRNYSPSEWRAFVEDAGLTIEAIGTAQEQHPIMLGAWMEKGGCQGHAAAEVVREFASAPREAREAFRIEPQAGGGVHFQWLRVVLAATKP
jgi:ubiquinone/menaquinone biosynthesis C-methylase UbiE